MALANQTLKYTHVLIQPTNVDDEGQKSKAVDLTSGLQFTNYYESLTSPVITIFMRCRFPMDVVNALPIRGGEMIAIELETLAGTFKFGRVGEDGRIVPGSGELYVYKVADIIQPATAQEFSLHITSLEHFSNETSRCMKRYKTSTIDEHVRDILKNTLLVKDEKISVIEKVNNSYEFIGNTKKPFHVIQWLCPKSVDSSKSNVSGSGKKGKAVGTVGFLFYENQKGFNFRSLNSLVSRTKIGSSDANRKIQGSEIHGPYIYRGNNASKTLYDLEENFVISEFYVNKNIDMRRALTVGQFANSTIFFNPINQLFSVYNYKLSDNLEERLGDKEDKKTDEVVKLRDHVSRLFARVSDHGAMGIGELGLEFSGRDFADQAKAAARYNNLFSQSLNIQVPLNTNLKVGDIINCEFPQLRNGEAKEIDRMASGNYLISALQHHIEPNNSESCLHLIRDSYGYHPIRSFEDESVSEVDKVIEQQTGSKAGKIPGSNNFDFTTM
tara:strand:- start:62 stop:1555 length:1494 start_codon:yes stop_codon:yes gene_type:complete